MTTNARARHATPPSRNASGVDPPAAPAPPPGLRRIGCAAAPDVLPLRRHDEPDVDAVHEDSLGAILLRQRLVEVEARRTVDRRREEVGVGILRIYGINVDHAWRVAAAQMRQCR